MTTDEWAIKTQTVADALSTAYDAMDEGTVAEITFKLATVKKATQEYVREYVVVDNGLTLESGILDMKVRMSRIATHDLEFEPHITLSWDATRHYDNAVELPLFVNANASRFAYVDVIDEIIIDDGIDESDLMTWYENHCMNELEDDITDLEMGDVE